MGKLRPEELSKTKEFYKKDLLPKWKKSTFRVSSSIVKIAEVPSIEKLPWIFSHAVPLMMSHVSCGLLLEKGWPCQVKCLFLCTSWKPKCYLFILHIILNYRYNLLSVILFLIWRRMWPGKKLISISFANDSEDRGSIPGRVIAKTQKMILDSALLLSIIRYISRVKWSNPGNGVAPSSTSPCSSYWKGNLRVTFD